MAATTMNAVTPLVTVLERLSAAGAPATGTNGTWRAPCPADGGSLGVKEATDGRVILTCSGGCSAEVITSAIGLTVRDLYVQKPQLVQGKRLHPKPELVEKYDYTDADGALLFQRCVFEHHTGRREELYRRPDPETPGAWIWKLDAVERVLYHLPAVIEAVSLAKRVFIVEGEQDVARLEALGYTATTNPGGAATSWQESYSTALKGADVVLVPLADTAGRVHARQVAASLKAAGATVRVVELPQLQEEDNVGDWIDARENGVDDFAEQVARARLWAEDPVARALWRLDELLGNEEIMRPPPPVVPRLAWLQRSTLLAARDKAGKSTLIGYIGAAVTQGRHFLDEPCARGTVLLVGLEEFIGDAARRLRHFDADPTRFYLTDKLPTNPEERIAAVRGMIDQVKPVLVFVDSLIAYGRGAISDLNAAAQVEPVVQEITDLAHATGPAVILVHHAQKSGDDYRDSTAIGGAVDVIALMHAPDKKDDALRAISIRGRVPGTRNFAFRFDGDHYQLDAGDPTRQGTDLRSIEDRVYDAIRSRPNISRTAVCQLVTGRSETVLATIDKMLRSGTLGDSGDGKHGSRLYVRA